MAAYRRPLLWRSTPREWVLCAPDPSTLEFRVWSPSAMTHAHAAAGRNTKGAVAAYKIGRNRGRFVLNQPWRPERPANAVHARHAATGGCGSIFTATRFVRASPAPIVPDTVVQSMTIAHRTHVVISCVAGSSRAVLCLKNSARIRLVSSSSFPLGAVFRFTC